MTEEQAKALKVGDKVRYSSSDAHEYMTNGKIYEIYRIDSDGDPVVLDADGDDFYICGAYHAEFELVESHSSKYRIEFVSTSECFDADGLSFVKAYVNDDLLAHLRDIESEQGREAKRKAIREQIAKLEAELEALK